MPWVKTHSGLAFWVAKPFLRGRLYFFIRVTSFSSLQVQEADQTLLAKSFSLNQKGNKLKQKPKHLSQNILSACLCGSLACSSASAANNLCIFRKKKKKPTKKPPHLF